MSDLTAGLALLLFLVCWFSPFLFVPELAARGFLSEPPPVPVAFEIERQGTPGARVRAPISNETRLERLSPEQARRLSDWLASWSRPNVDSTTAHHAEVEAAIARLYGTSSDSRLRFRWVGSPRAAPVTERNPFSPPDRRRLLPKATHLGLNVREQVLEQIAPSLDAQIRIALGRKGSGWQDYLTILNAFPSRRLVDLAAMDGASPRFDDQVAFYLCCREVLGVRFDDLTSARLDLLAHTAKCFGWWWPHRWLCVVSEAPSALHRDDRARLHHPRGPAVQFCDGFSVHAWHGTTVPKAWITAPAKLPPRVALTRPNLEQRRAALEIIGWKRVVDELQPRFIDTDADPAVGQLLEADLPELGPARFLKVRCGTGREFVLAVPRWMRTAAEANAWTYDLSADEYKLEVRT